jgi:hypothetical protein
MVSGGMLTHLLLYHVEMRVEGGGLEHFRKGQLHLVRERREVRCGNLMIGVLDQSADVRSGDRDAAAGHPASEISSAAWESI